MPALTARSLRSASVRVWVSGHGQTLLFLAVHGGDVERLRLLAVMRMLGARIDVQVLHLLALQRAAGDHALDRLLDHALGMRALEPLADGAALDAAGIAGVVVEDRLLGLVAGHPHLLGVDDDDVVAAIDMRGELRLVLAAQPVGDDRRRAGRARGPRRRSAPSPSHLRGLEREGGLQHGCVLSMARRAAA